MGTTYIEEFVAKLGFEVDATALTRFEKSSQRLKKTLTNVGKAAGIVAGAITGVVAISNRGTAKTDALAKSVGLTTENLIALSNAVKPLGFEIDNVVDLVEEMNNKIGESTGLGEQMTAVRESVQILGLEYEKLKTLAPEEQFFQILDAALALEDTQKAVSAVDMLTGGEGNKIIGFLRAEGKGIRQIVEDQKRLNLLTEDGIAGAKKFDSAFLKLTTVGKSLVDQFSGKLGDVLGPLIDDLVEWILVNEDLIQSELTTWAKEIGEFLVWIFETARDLVVTIGSLIEKIGGLKVAFRLFLVVVGGIVAVNFATWIYSAVVAIQSMSVAVGGLAGVLNVLKVAALGLQWLLIFGLIFLIVEDLFGFLTGKDSVIGDLSKEFENLLESANEYWANVFNMDPEDFRRNVVGFLEQEWTAYFSDALSWWGDFFSDLLSTIGSFFMEVFSLAGSWWSELFLGLWDTVVSWWEGLVDLFASGIESVVGLFTSFGEGILLFFTGIGDGIRGIVDSAFGFVREKIEGLLDILPDTVKDFLGMDSESKPAVKGSITGKFSKTGSKIADGVSNFGGNILAGLQGGGGTVADGVSNFGAGLFGGQPATAAAGGATYNITVPTNLAVSQMGELSPEQLTRQVSKAIGTEVSRAVRNNSEGVAY